MQPKAACAADAAAHARQAELNLVVERYKEEPPIVPEDVATLDNTALANLGKVLAQPNSTGGAFFVPESLQARGGRHSLCVGALARLGSASSYPADRPGTPARPSRGTQEAPEDTGSDEQGGEGPCVCQISAPQREAVSALCSSVAGAPRLSRSGRADDAPRRERSRVTLPGVVQQAAREAPSPRRQAASRKLAASR